MNEKSGKVLFADKKRAAPEDESNCWKILVVDDDDEVHSMTKMVLDDFVYAAKKVKLISAYTGKQAIELLKENPDVAIVILDVVMESDNAGLLVVKEIREGLKNSFVRIILRTGQPGQCPERDIIIDYDINDYKTKSELTSQKLFTTIVSSLRSHQDIVRIDQNRRGLWKIIESSASLFKLQSMEKFVSGILTQLISILDLKDDSMFCLVSGFFPKSNEDEYVLMAGTGIYANSVNKRLKEVVPPEIHELVKKAYGERKNVYADNCSIFFFETTNNSHSIVYVEKKGVFGDWDKKLVDAFCKNISIAFDNIYLYEKVGYGAKLTKP